MRGRISAVYAGPLGLVALITSVQMCRNAPGLGLSVIASFANKLPTIPQNILDCFRVQVLADYEELNMEGVFGVMDLFKAVSNHTI